MQFSLSPFRPGAPWDYKLQGIQYEDFGNFNFGAAGLAAGFSEKTLLQAAGAVQIVTDLATAGNRLTSGQILKIIQNGIFSGTGTPVTGPPYGDQLNDQIWIKKGFGYYYTWVNGGCP